MRSRRERILVWAVAAFVLLLVTLPYVYAWRAADADHVFGGFLLNPLDGNSYLAKMRQGWNGAWTFTLPYTAEAGEGAALNLYYLFLGHIARWTGASLLFTFHAARVLGAALMLAALYRFFNALFKQARTRLTAFVLAALGSGLGWVALIFGGFTPDFWLAEAYPFLAAYANAHFPLGLALQIALLIPLTSTRSLAWRWPLYALAAALLAIVYPFGLAVAGAVLGAHLALRAWRRLPLGAETQRLLALGIGGLPYAWYALNLVNQHPVLAAWHAQNQTPAPGPLDMLWALAPALLLALVGSYIAGRRGQMGQQMLLLWLLVALLLIYLPFSLQRRLASGLYIPLAGLAALGIEALSRSWRRWIWLAPALLLLSLPSNLLILAGGLGAAAQNNAELYLYADELAAFCWLEEHAQEDALVLAAPATGLYLPVYTDARVLYGHPFETVNADAQRQAVERFYHEGANAAWLRRAAAAYLLYGPREREIGGAPDLPGWQLLFEEGDLQIWGPLD